MRWETTGHWASRARWEAARHWTGRTGWKASGDGAGWTGQGAGRLGGLTLDNGGSEDAWSVLVCNTGGMDGK